jgi:L-iditol 2-dehydrogenase
METMQNPSAVLHGAHDLRIEDRPVPRTSAGQVAVEVQAVGICGSDVHYYELGRIGKYVVEAPMIIGHEAAGIVAAVGDGVSPSRIGELVALEPGVPCRKCGQCAAGRYNLCADVVFFATPPVDGAITRLVTIDAAFAHPAPTGMTVEQAAMAEPVSVGVWACRRASISAGDRVLVTGAGPIGLFAAQVARALGAAAVTVTDLNDHRLSIARELGLDARRVDSSLDADVDVLLECSGSPAALTSGMLRLAPTGRAVLVGMGADTATIDVPLVQGRELTLTGIFRYANTYPTALQLIASGAVEVMPVISHRFPLHETEAALTLARRDPHSLKAVVLPFS